MSSRNQWRCDHLLLLSLTAAMISSSFAFQSALSSKNTLRSFTQTNMIDSKSAADAILSTMLVQPAAGHSNPLFGAPDPYLAAGKSIPPTAKALSEFGITPAKTPADFAPNASPEYLQSIQEAMDKGWKITTIDKIKPTGATTLPGFSETHGILPNHHLDQISPATPAGFAAELSWSSKYFAVFDHLPSAIFWYCLVEFFLLRPGIDFYKEEIEADPTGATIDTAAVFGVRVIAIAIVSTLTNWFFGQGFGG